jgi:hypothetical protein
MGKEVTYLFYNLGSLLVFMIVFYIFYTEEFVFSEVLLRGVGFLILFNLFKWFSDKSQC